MNRCGTECELDAEEEQESAYEQVMSEVLVHASTEQLRDELKRRGYRVILEDQ